MGKKKPIEESDRRQHSSLAVFILVFTLLFEELAFLLVQGLVRGTSKLDRMCVVKKKDKQAVGRLDNN